MTQNVKAAGAWHASVPRVKVGGQWRVVRGGWVKVAGVWRRYHDHNLDTQVVTSGVGGPGGNQAWGFSAFATSFGTCTDGSSDLFGGAQVKGLYWNEVPQQVMFAVAGLQPNANWTTMTILGQYSLTRATAQYLQNAGDTFWSWNGLANPFLVNRIVTWT